jgi:predicted acetyltransferase
MKLKLRELTTTDEQAFLTGRSEWQGESPHWYSFIWNDQMTFQKMLTILNKESAGIDIPPHKVPHTRLYAFLEDQIIGRVSVGHQLNDYLKKRGGHLGYAVAPKFRNKGYATEMLRQALEYCKKINLTSVMITCAVDNIPSWKVIEKFGGLLDAEVWDDDDKEMIRKYWIKL